MRPLAAVEVGNTLGEGVLWHDPTQSVWWTDIEARKLNRYLWNERTLAQFDTPERLGAFGFVEGGTQLIAGFESGFAYYNPQNSHLCWIERVLLGCKGLRLNDGRVDRQGRFWCGAMAERDDVSASLYCLDGAGHLETRETGIAISNSICFSPDSAWFYFADTPKRTIWRYAFDATSGTISNREVFAETPDGAYPDGSTIDAEGYLWNAQWGASRVVRYTPDGKIDRVVDVPAKQPSCVAFGGDDLALLFVTTARIGLRAPSPDDGNLFVFDTGLKGLPEAQFGPSEAKQP